MQLQRITTEYVDTEDRIRLCAESAPNQNVVLWLTQRLLHRLVPHTLGWIEQQMGVSGGIGSDVRADVVNSFAQQAALALLEQQPPVQAHTAQTGWLVHSVDVTSNAQVLQLTFKGPPSVDPSAPVAQASVTMHAQALRQWLSILHQQCQRAGWVTASAHAAAEVWPEWIEVQRSESCGAAVLH